MAANPIRTAATTEAGLVQLTLLEAMVKRFGYVLDIGESLGDVDFDVGNPPLCVFSVATGYSYFYDSSDATTADDGLTCLVSGNGFRYHIEDSASISLNSVLGTATSPPGSPVNGDAWIVGAAATGGFAGQDDDIALYTRRGWIFATPELGLTVLDESTDSNTQFTSTGWGGFVPELPAGSITPETLAFPGGVVVESTLSTPPGSPTAGQWFIVGTSPTGAFVGHTGKLAGWDGAAYTFLMPAEGWTVWHKTFVYQVSYISGAWINAQMSLLSGVLKGCELSNNALDATNDIDIAAGKVVDSTGAVIINVPAITKQLDAAWAVGSGLGGRDTGAISNAWWHVWAILRSDTGVIDVLFSLSATAPTMPTGYDYKARIGSILRTAAAIKTFSQTGDKFTWLVPASDISAANPGTSAVTATLASVPTGITVEALLNAGILPNNPPGTYYFLLTALTQPDTVPSATAYTVSIGGNAGNSLSNNVIVLTMTNTSAQVRYRVSSSSAGVTVSLITNGWLDRRGKL